MRIAGKAGIGEGDRPYRPCNEGEFVAFELNDDLRDMGYSFGGGRKTAAGVLAMEAAGVKGAPAW